MHSDQFIQAFREWMSTQGLHYRPKDFAPDHVASVFDKRGLECKFAQLPYKRVTKHQKYVLGIKLLTEDDDNNEENDIQMSADDNMGMAIDGTL